MRTAVEVVFDAMLKACPADYDYNWSFNCSLDVKYKLDTYMGFKVFKWRVFPKDTIVFANTGEIYRKEIIDNLK
jgi:hypothetical protein